MMDSKRRKQAFGLLNHTVFCYVPRCLNPLLSSRGLCCSLSLSTKEEVIEVPMGDLMAVDSELVEDRQRAAVHAKKPI